MKTSIVILASGDIRSKLHYIKYNSLSPALIPVNTKPLASYAIDFYLNNKNQIFLVVQKDYLDEVQRELSVYKDKIHFVPIEPTKSPVDSLELALKDKRITNDVVINLVTTIPTSSIKHNQVFIAKEVDNYVNCSYVTFSPKKDVQFISKNEAVNLRRNGFAFTGVFRSEKKVLQKAVRLTLKKNDVLNVVSKLHRLTPLEFKKVDWIDCGHETNYYEAKKKLISSRSFNRIMVTDRGFAMKKSSNISKLKEEHQYIKQLPESLSIYFPRVFDLKPQGENLSGFSMEYYGYPNVSELLLYWDLSQASWHKLFNQLELILKDFGKYNKAITKKKFMDFYYDKLLERIKMFESSGRDNYRLVNDKYAINDLACDNFWSLAPKLKLMVSDLYDEKRFCIMHGDFCFNNILFDYSTGLVKLIDARGSFGKNCVGIYGDPLYDLAKLAHSAIGQYDYLVNNLYDLQDINGNYKIVFNERGNYNFVKSMCEDLIDRLKFSLKSINLIMATLFLSMPPFHADNKQKQKAMYLHGLYLLNKELQS